MLKDSDNAMTRLTYLRMGAKYATSGEKTLDAAQRTMVEWLATQGINGQGLVLENGSGLSRSERISPDQLAAVLVAAWRGAYFPELLDTLPVASRDGTLYQRLQGTAAEGQARLKTGTLRNADGLAGFVQDARKRLWVVVAIINQDNLRGRGRPVLDSVIEWVANQP
jgi:D-alanyl-D-alanine carboxypeptidase/D-alanyl-D-alanine-endopeptidase (penicillin-binding protein 4)